MKYLILGAGGTGGCLGAYLARAGHDVQWIARGRHLEAMRKEGLKAHTAVYGNFRIYPAKVCTMEEYQGCPDVVISDKIRSPLRIRFCSGSAEAIR